MRIVVQRVSEAKVEVAGEIVGQIGRGLVVFLGVGRDDTDDDIAWLVKKLAGLRVFEDPASGQMGCALGDVDGGALVVSQFTLFASTKKGTRPSFSRAAPPEMAEELYGRFLAALEVALGKRVERGVFAADMQVSSINDGPVTLAIDSRLRE